MSYYEKFLEAEKAKRQAEYAKNSWSIEPDNGKTGESVKDYYKKYGHC
jgi:hypothetical protein